MADEESVRAGRRRGAEQPFRSIEHCAKLGARVIVSHEIHRHGDAVGAEGQLGGVACTEDGTREDLVKRDAESLERGPEGPRLFDARRGEVTLTGAVAQPACVDLAGIKQDRAKRDPLSG